MKISIAKNLDPLRASALARLNELVGARVADLTSSPIAVIRARKAAEAALAGGSDPTPLLIAEASAKSVSVSALAIVVLANAEAATAALAAVEADRQARQAAIRAATHPAAIAAVLADYPETT